MQLFTSQLIVVKHILILKTNFPSTKNKMGNRADIHTHLKFTQIIALMEIKSKSLGKLKKVGKV